MVLSSVLVVLEHREEKALTPSPLSQRERGAKD